jgi:hypothetical protein
MSDDAPESLLIENDRDSLHVLPLEILPLKTPQARADDQECRPQQCD